MFMADGRAHYVLWCSHRDTPIKSAALVEVDEDDCCEGTLELKVADGPNVAVAFNSEREAMDLHVDTNGMDVRIIINDGHLGTQYIHVKANQKMCSIYRREKNPKVKHDFGKQIGFIRISQEEYDKYMALEDRDVSVAHLMTIGDCGWLEGIPHPNDNVHLW